MILNERTEGWEEREEAISRILPKEPFTCTILEPAMKTLFPTIVKAIKAELEVYRLHPKKIEKPKEEVKTLDPTNNETCLMGKAFPKRNGEITDGELHAYRKAVGTIDHVLWGKCTLLEIWAADHFEKHRKMVTDAFKYGAGLLERCPVIKVHINPLFANPCSGKPTLTPDQRAHKEEMDLLLAKALAFGVNEPKKKKRRR